MQGRVLIIAGSDSGGGAGIQADIKTVTMLGGYASTAITALTAQNTQGVFGIHEVPPGFVAEQMDLVLSDIGADAIKMGMLYSQGIIETVEYILQSYATIPLILDTVMVAKGGGTLLESGALDAFKSLLIPKALLVTPNIPEAQILTGRDIHTIDDMKGAAADLLAMGAQAALVKGGHMGGEMLYDVLAMASDTIVFEHQKIHTPHTHGTGCTLASAIACCIAQGKSLQDSVAMSRNYVYEAIRTAPGIGKGHGPLNHGWRLGIRQ